MNIKYNWKEIQAYYDEGHSVASLKEKFGVNRNAVEKAIKRGDFVRRSLREANGKPLHALVKRDTLKAKLLREGYLPYICDICGIADSWNGKPLVLQVHHINGNNKDNRIENLQILCPNCHSQTENYAGRKRKNNGL